MGRMGQIGVLVACALMAADGAFAGELMAEFNIGRFRVFYVPGHRIALTDANGLTLYTYGKDDFEVSACTDACTAMWPPMVPTADEPSAFESFSTFVRADGRRQWAFEGKPLYRNVLDAEPGQANGLGGDAAWQVVEVPAHEM